VTATAGGGGGEGRGNAAASFIISLEVRGVGCALPLKYILGLTSTESGEAFAELHYKQ
jgi:hypothetical protein